MKKNILFTGLLASFLLVNLNLNSSNNIEEVYKPIRIKNKDFNGRSLTIYNCADYIDEALIEAFEDEYNCKINYYTYDTNETMYNQLTLQPEGTYDLVCTSDYMIQRMIREGLVEKINIQEDLPTYDKYVSKVARNKISSLYADTNEDGVKDTSLDEYAAGYMWGTLGIIYDPYCSDTIREDVKSWDIFWDEKYTDLISIKNSMRDTFVVGLMHAYKGSDVTNQEDILTPAREAFLAELNNASTEEEKELARNKYNKVIQDTFDLIINEEDYAPILEIVKQELISLKQNIFGFEVDSGKNDIITGKIKMNLAWSGDAVYSIDQAYEQSEKVLEYYVPDDGSNVWYDGWTLPKGSDRELAFEFIEYLSTPENAAQNMNYIGYTSFIACDEVFDLVSSWYGVSEYNSTSKYYASYYDEEEDVEVDANVVMYNNKFYECIKDTTNNDPLNEEYWTEIDKEELGLLDEAYDLSYFFKGNVTEGRSTLIYPYDGSLNQLETQYPSIDTIARCAVMNDFEEANADVVIMWGQVKAYTNMLPYYIFLSSVLAFVVIAFTVSIIKKQKSTRNKRRLEENK